MAKIKERPEKNLNAFTITSAVIASFVVTLILYLGLVWLIESLDNPAAISTNDIVIFFLIFGFVLAPTFIAAAVVAVMLRKPRKN